jgi:hypothetical protein
MRTRLLVVALSICLVAPFLRAQSKRETTVRPLEPMWAKSENGLLITWHRGISTDALSSTVYVFDKQGSPYVDIDVLKLAPEAKSVSIYDVSVQPDKLIAVAAVYVRAGDVPPAAALLLLDGKGNLLRADALAPAREISLLAVDEQLNTWTLVAGSEGDEAPNPPLVVEYNEQGVPIREVLPRSLFPLHQEAIYEAPPLGAAVAGYSEGNFWFWLPKSTDFVTIRTVDGAVLSRTQTGYPTVAGANVMPLQFASDGAKLIAQTRVEQTGSKAKVGHFVWSPNTKTWTSFVSDCGNHRLIGTEGNEPVYIHFDKTTATSVCSSPVG